MKPRVYHSFRSPYSRLGLHRVARAELDIDLIPFTGPPNGVPFNDPVQNKPKLAYYAMDAPRMTIKMGLPIAMPDPFDVDFDFANRALVLASRSGNGLQFALAVSDARWGAGKNVAQLPVLEECARAAGLAPGLIAEAQDNDDVLAEMTRHREQIEVDQVFGVPFAVYGAAKYWGHDRFDLLIDDVRRS